MEEIKKSKSQATIEIEAGGPLKITGNFILKDLRRDMETSPREARICRCGKSSTMPYCDESHKTA